MLTFGLLLLAAAMPTFAQSKEAALNEMLTIAEQLEAKTSAPDFADLLARYAELAAELGGYDPANLLESGGVAPNGAGGAVIPPPPPNCTSATTTFTDPNATAIPDGPGGMVDIDLVVGGAGTYLWDLNLQTSITHTWNADLIITLTSPAGTSVTVTSNNGGQNDDVFNGTDFDDSAGTPATDAIYANLVTATPLVIEEALAAFNGEDPNGTWTLSIEDTAAQDTGSVDSWALEITTLDTAPIEDAPVVATNNTPTAIPDGPGGMVDITLDVAGAGTSLCDVDLDTSITHTWNADLIITLTSPAGTTATITSNNGGQNDDVFNGTTWDDNGGEPATDFTYANLVTATPLVAEGALGAFIGEDPNGTWTLSIEDTAAQDTGSVDAWGLTVTTCACSADPDFGGNYNPAIPTLDTVGLVALLIALAMVGIFVMRRRRA